MPEDDPGKPETAAELLGDWRSAERDSVAARHIAEVARLALEAAEAAEQAATEVEAAAAAASEAVERARDFAGRARRAAAAAATAAQLALAQAQGDKFRADLVVEDTDAAEAAARDRFHDAEGKGFPRE